MGRQAVSNPRQMRSRSCSCAACRDAYPDVPRGKRVAKECTGPWQYRYYDMGGRRRGKTLPTKTEAESFGDKIRADKRARGVADSSRGQVTVAWWWGRWWPTQGGEAATRARDESLWRNHIEPHWGGWKLADIEHPDIAAWVKQLSGDLSPASVAKVVQLLRRLLGAAVMDRKRIPENPCTGVKLPAAVKKHPEDRKPPTPQQMDAIRAALPAHYRDMVIVSEETGLRWGELVALRLCRVDLTGGRAQVREVIEEVEGKLSRKAYPKSSAGLRTVPLTPRAVEAIRRHLAQTETRPTRSAPGDGMHPEELVFRGPRGGVLSRTNFRRVWVKAIKDAKVARKVRRPQSKKYEWWPHEHHIRHALASRLAATGVPEVVTQEILGHERGGEVTWQYTHAAADSAGQVLAALADAEAVAAGSPNKSPSPVRMGHPTASLGVIVERLSAGGITVTGTP